jgi:uncharacterized protein
LSIFHSLFGKYPYGQQEFNIFSDIMAMKEVKGEISVKEAGRRGGNMTKKRHGHEFYEKIGHKGGQKVKELIERGKSAGR